MKARVLIVDDEANIRTILTAMLTREGYECVAVEDLTQAKRRIREEVVHVVLSDLRLEREEGVQLLKWLREERLPLPVIILTAHGTVDAAVDAMKQGAFDFLTKPFDRAELVRVIEKASLTYQYHSQSVSPAFSLTAQLPLLGQSPKMMKVFQIVEKVAPTDATVLLLGESGTGKELIAQVLHEKSLRCGDPLVKISCAAIAPTLLESELFGYEKGAFTGAETAKPGRFELADNGTLFLDEIAEMSAEMQVKLLRVLQERTFSRVGGLKTIRVNVRLIAATNRDLEEEIRQGRFRQDLYYRLNVLPIHLPPLRERPQDIPLLVSHFVKRYSARNAKRPPSLMPETLELLMQYPWPGNIRQLENVIERTIIVNEGDQILPDQLPEEILEYEEQKFLEGVATSGGSLKEIVRDATRRIEKKAIEDALFETNRNVTQAARILNLSRKGLQLKMKELGLR